MQDSSQNQESSAGASPARTSASLESERALPEQTELTLDLDFSGRSFVSLTKPKRQPSSSKTSQDFFRLTTDGISPSFSMRFKSAGTSTSRGEFLMHNSLESPSEGVVYSSLADVLEPWGEHLRKYLLSPKAALGILRRASKRGKQLPEMLRKALELVSLPAHSEDTKRA